MSSGGDMHDAPNQQVVRPDGSAPWEEGDGGSTLLPDQGPGRTSGATSLDDMTKDELLTEAQRLGVSPANAGMTKDELRAGIDAHLASEAAS
jgi:hypothetical protein